MKKVLKRFLISLLVIIVVIIISGLVLAFLPSPLKKHHKGISPEEAAELRAAGPTPYKTFKTSDGVTLFLREWVPDTTDAGKKDLAVLLFHGITAHSGAYEMAGVPISEAGYMVFGFDYRGHGLSDGNRGDSPGRERWTSDLVESVRYLKTLGFKRVVVMGHSLGVAAAICVTDAIPDELAGVILLSGAYESKTGSSVDKIRSFEKLRIISSSVFRPSRQAVEYYPTDQLGLNDSLFNFKYTLRFLTMLDVKKLRLPENLKAPVLVAVGDNDEIFAVDKVKEFYDQIPGHNKQFMIWKGATHADIKKEHWQQIAKWLDENLTARP